MKIIGTFLLNGFCLVFSSFVMVWAYPESYMETHSFTFSMLVLSFVIVHVLALPAVLDGRFKFLIPGIVYFAIMDFSMFLESPRPDMSIFFLWFAMVVSLLGSIAIFLLLQEEESNEKNEKQEAQYPDISTPSFYDVHNSQNERFSKIADDAKELSEYVSYFDAEKLQQLERTMQNLHTAVTNFEMIREKNRFLVEEEMEILFTSAEEQVEHLKTTVDEWHILEIRKRSQEYETMC